MKGERDRRSHMKGEESHVDSPVDSEGIRVEAALHQTRPSEPNASRPATHVTLNSTGTLQELDDEPEQQRPLMRQSASPVAFSKAVLQEPALHLPQNAGSGGIRQKVEVKAEAEAEVEAVTKRDSRYDTIVFETLLGLLGKVGGVLDQASNIVYVLVSVALITTMTLATRPKSSKGDGWFIWRYCVYTTCVVLFLVWLLVSRGNKELLPVILAVAASFLGVCCSAGVDTVCATVDSAAMADLESNRGSAITRCAFLHGGSGAALAAIVLAAASI